MKLSELLVEARLSEGTWSLPDSHHAVVKLMKLLDAPVPTSEEKMKVIYSVVGDDDLFDELNRASKEKLNDVRHIILSHLPRLLDTSTWIKKPDDETLFAIKMLKKKYDLR